jgi:uncharacterized cupin superfamily protein
MVPYTPPVPSRANAGGQGSRVLCRAFPSHIGREGAMRHAIINIADLDFHPVGNGQRFQGRMGEIADHVGAQKLGYNLTVVPPGKTAFPRHSHRVNEEMFFVVEGEGEIRIGEQRFPIRPGDVIACPPGGPETAHQIINTSTTMELKYLAVSTHLSPEIVDYPDSGKFGVRMEYPSADGGEPRVFRFIGRAGASLDYFDGE